MEKLIKEALTTSTLKEFGRCGGGCINDGQGYMTDNGPVFVKKNPKSEAKIMFDGELYSLSLLYATNTVKVPKPIKAVKNGDDGGAILITEYIEMHSGLNKYASDFGRQLAKFVINDESLHLFNGELLKRQENDSSFISCEKDGFSIEPTKKFGFNTATCCGYLAQNNEWQDDWVEFYTRQRLKPQIDAIIANYGDREIVELWSHLERKVSNFFLDLDEIVPSLVHGDLWNGNVGETDSEPVIFDPASFFGHSEYEFGIATMFGGFPSSFFKSYHEIIPKTKNFEKRLELYQLFHYLNHWNHFGESYKNSSLSLMRRLIKQ